MGVIRGLLYIVVQLLAAIISVAIVHSDTYPGIYGLYGYEYVRLTPAHCVAASDLLVLPPADVSLWSAFAVEFFMTFILVFVVFSVAFGRQDVQTVRVIDEAGLSGLNALLGCSREGDEGEEGEVRLARAPNFPTPLDLDGYRQRPCGAGPRAPDSLLDVVSRQQVGLRASRDCLCAGCPLQRWHVRQWRRIQSGTSLCTGPA